MQAQCQPPPPGPHTGVLPSNLQNPSTLTLSHVHHNPSDSIGVLPSAPTTIPPSKNRSATAFVPRKPVTVTVKNAKGVEMSLAGPGTASVGPSMPPSPAGLRHGSPGTPGKRTSVRIESEDQRKQRLAEERRRSDRKLRLRRRSGRRRS